MPDEPEHPLLAVLRALGVRRNAAVGLVVGALLAVAMYAYRVLELGGPTPATGGSPLLFLLLAFVLAVSSAALVTVALTLGTAIRRARDQ